MTTIRTQRPSHRIRLRCCAVLAGLLGLAACDSGRQPIDHPGSSSKEIQNGTVEPDAVGTRIAEVYVDTDPGNPNSALYPYGSGTLLTNEWVLTAGHNTRRVGVQPVSPISNHFVELGPLNVKTAQRVELHPDYVELSQLTDETYFDVALIRVSPFVLDGSTTGYQRPISSATAASLVGTTAKCYGYGRNSLTAPYGSGTLRYANLTIAYAFAPTPPNPPDHYFRTLLNASNQVQLEGDSGGPCLDGSGWIVGVNKNRDSDPTPQYAHATLASAAKPWADFVMNTIASVNVTPWGGPTMQRGTLGFYVAPGVGGDWVWATYLANPYDASSTTLPWPVVPLAFAPTQALVAGGDFNGDGVTDFFGLVADAANALTTYWNGGQYTFTEYTSSGFVLPSGSYESFVGHDFDDDGYDDLLVTDTSGASKIYHGSQQGLVAPVDPIDMWPTQGWADPDPAQEPEGAGGGLTVEPAQDPEAGEPVCSGPICVSGGESGPDGVIYSRADNPMLNVTYPAEQLDVSFPQWVSGYVVENILPGGAPYENEGSWKRRLMPWPWWEGHYSGNVSGFASGVMLGYGDGTSATHALELHVVGADLPAGQVTPHGTTKLELHPDTRLVPVRVVVFDDYSSSDTGVTLQDAAMLFDRVPTMLEGSLLNAESEASDQAREWGIWQGVREINGQFKTFHKGILLPDDAWFGCGVQFRMVSFDRVLGPGHISRPSASEAFSQVLANYTYVRGTLYGDLPVVMIMADCGKPGFSLYEPVSGFPIRATCLSWDTGKNGVLAFLMGELVKAHSSGSGGVMEISEANYTPTQNECESINSTGVADEAAAAYRQGIEEMAPDPNCSDYAALTNLENCPGCPYTPGLDSPVYEGVTHIWHGGS